MNNEVDFFEYSAAYKKPGLSFSQETRKEGSGEIPLVEVQEMSDLQSKDQED